MIINNNSKRLAIYFFYDKNGIVDGYVPYFLEDLKKNVTEIFIICNGLLNDSGKAELSKFGNVIVRENKGYDVWAYRSALKYYGWDDLAAFDEVILLNSTLMGPVYPFKDTFQKMADLDLDFWGITEHFYYPEDTIGCCKYGYIPDHIQSHFIVCRKSLICSKAFQEYWDDMPMINNYLEAIGKHELIFTKHFEDLGFKWGLSVEMEDLRDFNAYPLMMCTKKLIVERNCPVFKRRSFFHDPDNFLTNTAGETVSELYNFIKDETNYNENHIWETILRNYNQADIVKNMNLVYVLPTKYTDFSNREISSKSSNVALVMHLYFEDLLEESLTYAKTMPENSDVIITTDSEEKKRAIEEKFKELFCNKLEIKIIENRGRDVSSLLIGVRDIIEQYDIVCFMHDKKTAQVKPGTQGAGFAYKCLENILASKSFVTNVIQTFEENPQLGILSPPEPNHGEFFTTLGQEWTTNYKNVLELAGTLGITIPIDETKPPIAPYGTMFWFRPKAMKCLFAKDWKYDDFPKEPNENDGTILHAIERIYPFVVQQEGFYPGIVMSDKVAAIEYGNLRYYVRGYNEILMRNHIQSYYYTMKNMLANRLNDIENGNIVAQYSTKAFVKVKIKKVIKQILPLTVYNKGKAVWKKIRS